MSGKGISPMAQREIERKWRVTELPALEGLVRREITQGYLSIGSDGSEVRIRRDGDRYFQTAKSGGDLDREEDEVPITREKFDELWPSTDGKRIFKTRYEIPYEGRKIEIDVYREGLTGLIVAEAEFPSTQVAVSFTPPVWLGAEVTEDQRYKNRSLAVYGLPEGY